MTKGTKQPRRKHQITNGVPPDDFNKSYRPDTKIKLLDFVILFKPHKQTSTWSITIIL